MSNSPRRLARRALLHYAFLGGSGLLTSYLVGCGDGGQKAASPTAATAFPTTSPAVPTITPAPTATAAALGWRPLSAAGPLPPPRRDHSLVTDGRSLFLFGGRSAGTLGDLWSHDLASGAWTEIKAAGGPPARFGHNAVFDRTGARMVLFGGQDGATFFNDVWALDVASGRWSQLPGTGAPKERYGAGGALDPAGRLLITHGFTTAGRFDDTWSYDVGRSAWAEVSPQGQRPIERCLMRAVWDSGAGRLLMFGGQTTGTPFLGDLWELRGGGWTELTVEPKPSPRNFYAMAFDDEGRRLILAGGNSQEGPLNDVWFFDSPNNSWSRQAPQGESPSPRFGHDAAWLPDSRRLIFFGGSDGQADLNDLWELTVPL